MEWRNVDHQFAALIARLCPENPERAKALAGAVSAAAASGHTCWPVEDVPPLPVIESVVQGPPASTAPLVAYAGGLYLRKLYVAEQSCAQLLRALANETCTLPTPERARGVSDEQYAAICQALQHRLAVITGGPGTGKTTIVKHLLAALHTLQPHLEVAAAAPTGKAAARLKEALGEGFTGVTQTVQRLLKIRPDTGKSAFTAARPLKYDVVVIDEASMVDLMLMQQCLQALKPGARLILLGDPYQLASVEAGAVLNRIVEAADAGRALSGCVIRLTKSHRFAADRGVGQLAAAVNAGDRDTALRLCAAGGGDIVRENLADVISAACAGYGAYRDALRAQRGKPLGDDARRAVFSAFNAWRVFSPYRKGAFGVEGLNQYIEAGLGLRDGEVLYFGRPLMVTGNHPALGLYNGDIGLVLDAEGKTVCFPSSSPEQAFREIAVAQLPSCETAFALTVHKSQGSEFPACLLVVPAFVKSEGQQQLLTRELLYTAITRCSERFHIAASDEDIAHMVATPTVRYSNLLA